MRNDVINAYLSVLVYLLKNLKKKRERRNPIIASYQLILIDIQYLKRSPRRDKLEPYYIIDIYLFYSYFPLYRIVTAIE